MINLWIWVWSPHWIRLCGVKNCSNCFVEVHIYLRQSANSELNGSVSHVLPLSQFIYFLSNTSQNVIISLISHLTLLSVIIFLCPVLPFVLLLISPFLLFYHTHSLHPASAPGIYLTDWKFYKGWSGELIISFVEALDSSHLSHFPIPVGQQCSHWLSLALSRSLYV